jgi:uncharacterized protein YndB with AHSA1/START domain
MAKLTVELSGDTGIIVRRFLNATPQAVFDAHTDPEIIAKWMIGSPDWTMPVCHSDARPGGLIRYEWHHPTKPGFYLTGTFIEVTRPHRILHVERMFLPDQTPDNQIETTFTPQNNGTLMTMRMSLPDAATRNAMMASGMADGMSMCYDLLETLV